MQVTSAAQARQEEAMLIVTIPLRPMAAPRMTQRSKWQPRNQEYLAWKEAVGLVLGQAMKGQEPVTGPVALSVLFSYRGRSPGDLSNLLKAIEDAANRILWVDDRQIRRVEAVMVKGRTERIGLVMRVMEKEKP